MLKDYMWNIFKNTGSIKSYVFYREIVERESSLVQKNISYEQTATTNIS